VKLAVRDREAYKWVEFVGTDVEMGIIMKKATFGAGCFWGVELAFRQVEGVSDVAVGYSGGTVANPTYHDVCSGRTGHAEVVEVDYDPERVSFAKLLDVFWSSHDPTTPNRQGPDVGTQYRSAIFTHDEEQRAEATASRTAQDASGRFRRPIVTEITPASTFYRGEEYHQRYLEKHGRAGCSI
jgi:peptide-methionine (S)-S-oxide reductase